MFFTKDRRLLVNDLILSVAAVLTFLGLEHFLVVQGFTNASWLLGVVGVLLLFYADRFDKAISTDLINKRIIVTVSHVLIFVTLKIYLDVFIEQLWWLFLVVGVLLINKSYWFAGLKK